jgi:hypothetical protein
MTRGRLDRRLRGPVSFPQFGRSEVTAVEQPTLRIAPDGRHALVASAIEKYTSFGSSASVRQAWIIGLDGPTLGPVVAANAIAGRQLEDCAWVAFVEPEIIAKGCHHSFSDGSSSFEVRRYDLAGRDLGPAFGDMSSAGSARRLNGVAYTWDGHTRWRRFVRGDWRRVDAGPGDPDDPGVVVIHGERPPPGPRRWSNGRSAADGPQERTLVDRRRLLLYAPRPGLTRGAARI